jgi:hypothetical protein
MIGVGLDRQAQRGPEHNICKQWREGIGQRGGLLAWLCNSGKAAEAADAAVACSMELSGRREWGWKDTILMMQEACIGW